ncbi:polymer-forming cytoskeletal protein [Aedoeadaptatus urinae]|uniref:polymer-forming cytoskeletal protein n=1 Tax=Aedoeadaptatus urinae TaxID=1871017 RepID=UPI00097CF205|nr:polymer-forming cytoskeletal protein [Peptoniphilus urinae]
MTKRRGSIALLAIFIFAIISLLALVIFSRLEDNFLLLRTELDEKQSSYNSESLVYLAKEELKKEQIVNVVEHRVKLDLPAPAFNSSTVKKAEMSPFVEKGSYTRVQLEVQSSYKSIPSKAILRFKGVNPIFEQPDGVISTKEMKERGVYDTWQKTLADSFLKETKNWASRWKTDKPSTLKKEGNNFIQVLEDGSRATLAPVALQLRWEVASPVVLDVPMDIKGVLWLKKGASIKGDIHVRGVVIREEGASVEGQMIVDGLLIGEKDDAIHVNFQPRNVEEVFCFFDDFIQSNSFRLKKLY